MVKLFGIDVSHWQGEIDWTRAGSCGVDFAIIKATQGATFVDPQFRRNARQCPVPKGYYHFLDTADPAAAVREAEHFLRQLEGLDAPMGCWLDCEQPSIEKMGKTALTAAANAFLERVEAQIGPNGKPYRVGVYCNKNWAKNFLDLTDPKGLARYRFWYARPCKGDQPPQDTGRQADIWQFGVSADFKAMTAANVDCNYAYFEPEA